MRPKPFNIALFVCINIVCIRISPACFGPDSGQCMPYVTREHKGTVPEAAECLLKRNYGEYVVLPPQCVG